jgi:hypothetical protein
MQAIYDVAGRIGMFAPVHQPVNAWKELQKSLSTCAQFFVALALCLVSCSFTDMQYAPGLNQSCNMTLSSMYMTKKTCT